MRRQASDEAADSSESSALAGDRSAWNALIRRHNHRVVIGLIARSIAPARAQDLAQEAWARLIRQADLGRIQSLVLPGLVIRQALFLATSVDRVDMSPQAADVVELTTQSPEEQFLTAEKLARVRQRIQKMPDRHQEIFRLLAEDSWRSHAEISERVGLSLQRVRQIICEVRKVLRREIEGERDE